jgi:hypothetical protein
MRIAAGILLAVLAGALPSRGAEGGADPAAAERQYRVARRLATERSKEAGAAFQQAHDLDPAGALADDALLEKALLLGVPAWPEDLGRISRPDQQAAIALLEQLTTRLPSSDRAAEARLRLALLRVEPLPGRDAMRARVDLLGVAAAEGEDGFGPAARYAVAWLDEIQGSRDRAADTYARVLVDAPASETASRARVALARILLRRGDASRAASLAQEALDAEAPAPKSAAAPLREGAVRALLRSLGPGGTWASRPPRTVPGVYRTVVGIALCPGGDLVVADDRAGTVTRLDASGGRVAAWTLPAVVAVTVDPYGRIFAADEQRVFRLEEGVATPVGDQGKLGPVRSLAVDPEGRIFALDRRGTRILRLDAGATAFVQVSETRDYELTGLAWDGARLVALDAGSGTLVEVERSGGFRAIPATLPKRATALAVSPAGDVALVDPKTGDIVLHGPQGEPRERLAARPLGIEKPLFLALALDGSLRVVDGEKGSLTVIH